jgi:hypothetical protein
VLILVPLTDALTAAGRRASERRPSLATLALKHSSRLWM